MVILYETAANLGGLNHVYPGEISSWICLHHLSCTVHLLRLDGCFWDPIGWCVCPKKFDLTVDVWPSKQTPKQASHSTIQKNAQTKPPPTPLLFQHFFCSWYSIALELGEFQTWVGDNYVIIIYIASPLLPYIIAVSQCFFGFTVTPRNAEKEHPSIHRGIVPLLHQHQQTFRQKDRSLCCPTCCFSGCFTNCQTNNTKGRTKKKWMIFLVENLTGHC